MTVRLMRRPLRMTNARIEERDQQVDDQVHDQEGGGDDQHGPDDRVEVLLRITATP